MRIMEQLVRGRLAVNDGIRKAVDRLNSADDRGASALEYALLIGGIALAVIVAVRALGGTISDLFGNAETQVTTP